MTKIFQFCKRYSTKVNFLKHTESTSIKNLLYFSGSLQNKSFKELNKTALQDLEKNNFITLYNNNTTLNIKNNFSDRMLFVKTPTEKDKIRKIVSQVTHQLMSYKLNDFHIEFAPDISIDIRGFILNNIFIANYLPDKEKTGLKILNIKDDETKAISVKELNVIQDEIMVTNSDEINFWITLAKSNIYTRFLANTRCNLGSIEFFENEANKIINENTYINHIDLNMTVIKGEELLKQNMNLLYNVGKSAQSEPRLITIKYLGDKSNGDKIDYAIVGKGITFDTGGLNLKPTGYMEDMFLDKHGACNALAIFKYALDLKLKINLVCVMALAENSIDSKSYKPSDIIKSRKGYTVEITNTDAEGRLVLADALTYVQEIYHPTSIINLATLTGACMGNKTAGLFTNNPELASKVMKCSNNVLESFWEMPINNEHRKDITSTFADLKNAGNDKYGGASKAAAFLEAFIEKDTKWVHLDIAGPAMCSKKEHIITEGGTGFATQTLLSLLNEESKSQENPIQ